MWILSFVLVSLLAPLATSFQVGVISNVVFIPQNISGIVFIVNQSCIACVCYARQQNYSGFNCYPANNSCMMFPTYSATYSLNSMTNSSFYLFQLPPIGSDLQTTTTDQSMVYRNLTSMADILVGIWNATVGGDSLNVTLGTSNGQYPNVNEGPAGAHDYNIATKYNSYGTGNSTTDSGTAGVGTGFYVTMAVGACVVTGIQFATANDNPLRDPITMTLEGSNVVNSSLLSRGSSWTLIYSGPTGISNTTTPNRTTYVDPQSFTNTARFTSYRFIMTSQRGANTNLQYSEAHLLGYV